MILTEKLQFNVMHPDTVWCSIVAEWQPVAYTSHAPMDCETRFVQIKKECLAILFACEHFDLYLYGREKITVEMDHQALKSIFKKLLRAPPIHLQKMRMRLHQYSIEVRYKKGSQMYLANTLSRAVVQVNYVCSWSEDRLESIASVGPTVTLMIHEDNIQRIQRETAKDQSFLKLSCVIKSD